MNSSDSKNINVSFLFNVRPTFGDHSDNNEGGKPDSEEIYEVRDLNDGSAADAENADPLVDEVVEAVSEAADDEQDNLIQEADAELETADSDLSEVPFPEETVDELNEQSTESDIPENNAEPAFEPVPESNEEDSDAAADEGNIDITVEEEKGTASAGGKAPVLSRALYHERYYLLYGAKEERSLLSPAKTKNYLVGLGFGNNSLKQAREGKDIASLIEKTYDPTRPGAHFCDFCGVELVGTEYEILADGRERCMQCGRSAVKTAKEFVEIFNEVKQKMEGFFDIKFNVSIHVEMTTSKKLAKRTGTTFTPTSGFDARAVGVAIRDQSGYTLLIENGTPRVSTMLTIAHELTHIWQYLNWNDEEIVNKYGAENRLEVYEGMAKWVEIQYALLINEVATATREKILTLYRDDEYGRGFVRYINRYPMSKGSSVTKETPFVNGNTPL